MNAPMPVVLQMKLTLPKASSPQYFMKLAATDEKKLYNSDLASSNIFQASSRRIESKRHTPESLKSESNASTKKA